MAGMAGIMKDLPRIKAKLKEVKEDVSERTVEASVGNGGVVAVASGRMRIVSLRVDPVALASLASPGSPDNAELVADLVVEAINLALDKAQEMVSKAITEAAEEFGFSIPPNALEGLL
jgi:hypothetical protein